MLVNSGSVRLIVGPEPVIDVTVHVDEFSFSMGAVIAPFSRILRAVWPDLLAKAVAEATLPFSLVGGARLELIELTALSRLVRVPVAITTDGFTGLFLSEVFATSKLVGTEHARDASGLIPAPESLNFRYKMHLLLEDVR